MTKHSENYASGVLELDLWENPAKTLQVAKLFRKTLQIAKPIARHQQDSENCEIRTKIYVESSKEDGEASAGPPALLVTVKR